MGVYRDTLNDLLALVDGVAEIIDSNKTYKTKVDEITDLLVNDDTWSELSEKKNGGS